MGYTLNQWTALNRYCEDGDLSIDNNVSERTVKVAAIGRRNWLFVASPAGGRRAAILLSLTASAKANQVEPWAWLQDLFTRLPQLPDHPSDDDLEPFLPDHWLADHPHHRWTIDDIRRQARSGEQPRPCSSPNAHFAGLSDFRECVDFVAMMFTLPFDESGGRHFPESRVTSVHAGVKGNAKAARKQRTPHGSCGHAPVAQLAEQLTLNQ
jgi:hypothetical protein